MSLRSGLKAMLVVVLLFGGGYLCGHDEAGLFTIGATIAIAGVFLFPQWYTTPEDALRKAIENEPVELVRRLNEFLAGRAQARGGNGAAQ